MKAFRLFLFILSLPILLQAQDPDFSQQYATPLNLNPALAGNFNGTYRVGGIYRDAWRTASPVPIATYVFNGEYRFQMGTKKKNNDYGAAGLKFFSDRTSIIELNTNAMSAFFAYHKSLSEYSKNYLSIGFEAGITQKNLNYENLNFEDEFNGVNGFNGFTEEELQANNFGYGDYSIGLNYFSEVNKKNSFNIGLTAKHLTNPNLSFWRRSESLDPDLQKVNRAGVLLGFQAVSKHQLNYFTSISPRIVFKSQGPTSTQIFTGSTIRYDLNTFNKAAVHAGLFARVSNTESSFELAHITPFVGFEVNNMLLGISYDVNMHDVVNSYQGIGVLELSVSYTGEVIEDSAWCPEF